MLIELKEHTGELSDLGLVIDEFSPIMDKLSAIKSMSVREAKKWVKTLNLVEDYKSLRFRGEYMGISAKEMDELNEISKFLNILGND